MRRWAIGIGVLGLVGLVGAACAVRAGSPSEPRSDVPFTTLVQVGVPGQAGGERREAIRDAATWSRVWGELRTGSSLPETPPAVDFAREMVLVAAMPTQPCVSKVTVRAVIHDRGGLAVDLLEEPPAANCVCIVSQRPLHVVRLARSDAPVRFAATVTPHPC